MHMHRLLFGTVIAAGWLLGPGAAQGARAQLEDLQLGRNFPTAEVAFGAGRSENIDVGDADFDGDLDVIVANGGDGSAQANAFFLNQGGIQGGVEGDFVDRSAPRFAGVPNDTSRDIEFVDWDGDADLDVFVANRGTTVNAGEVNRAYRNQGGQQQGAIGFYSDDTDAFWGTLVDVPLTQEAGVQDGEGPFRDFSCDCDFGDLDDDGDLDLFHSTYGPNISGSWESRIFLNDGTGRFDELWPWANATADIQLHTLDIDLADFDGDFDLDVMASSRDSQARVYRNNLVDAAWATDPFTDITQTALIATGATLSGTSNYESEFADVDGDGDFDVWMTDYAGFTDRLLVNEGGEFSIQQHWIKGDPNVDTNELDFFDYDGDGDLDAFEAIFSGTNRIYQSSLVDGIALHEGLFHRTGTGLAPALETPSSGNGGTTLDGECADLDGDGDTDLLLVNDGNQNNRYWENVLGEPDTHAPTFAMFTQQADKADGTDTVIHAAVRDNDPYYIIAFDRVNLIYSVGSGPETCVVMASQGGQQFRGVIPGELSGMLSYRVEATDGNGNLGVSSTVSYLQTSSGAALWENLGCGTEGVAGVPSLTLSGNYPAAPVTYRLLGAAPNAFFLTWLSFSSTPFNALGGEVYAFPFATQVLAVTDAGGMFTASTPWPAGVPAGTETYWQAIVQDASSIHGLVLSNAMKGTSP